MATRFEHASHKLVTSNATKKFANEENTYINCPQKRDEAPQTVCERVLHRKTQTTASSFRWLERTSKLL